MPFAKHCLEPRFPMPDDPSRTGQQVRQDWLRHPYAAAGQYTVAVWATDDGTTVAPSGDPTWTMPVAVASDHAVAFGPSGAAACSRGWSRLRAVTGTHYLTPFSLKEGDGLCCLRPQRGRGV